MKHWRWDIHTDKVSRRCKAWASSDRGWLFGNVTVGGKPVTSCTNWNGRTETLGHYLDYTGTSCAADHPGETVHAVSCVSRSSSWHATPEEAQRWIESEALASALAALSSFY